MRSTENTNHNIWAIVPAAGIGRRMKSQIPKQYLPLNGRPVLEHTLNTLLKNENINGLVVALNPDDAFFPDIRLESTKPVIIAAGGKERADSVFNALRALHESGQFDMNTGWVMVHDAVRACLRDEDIQKLVNEVGNNPDGGLLALPVRDTMKRQHAATTAGAGDKTVAETVDRENLWHALTPQYFPAISLANALEKAIQNNMVVTDESSAMEMAGCSPKLVEGHEDNIKITRPGDLRLAALYLEAREKRDDSDMEQT